MFNAAVIRERIAAVAESEAGLEAGAARDAAFHMTDWPVLALRANPHRTSVG